MRQPSPLQRAALAVVGLTVFGAAGAWLGLSYFGIVSSDVKVSVETQELGDSLGPGAKVRYHGIIVGRVLTVGEHAKGYRVNLLVGADHADEIPAGATARILPSTLFGSEYVELLSAAHGERPIASGDVLQADRSRATLRLMDSFDDAERLISSVDVEQMNRALNTLAPAIDGHGDEIAHFLRDTDDYVTSLNGDADLFFGSLALTANALTVLTDVEPDLVSALANVRTTADTIVDKDADVGTLLTSTRDFADTSYRLVNQHGDAIADLNRTLAPLTSLVAQHPADVRSILQRTPRVLHNGASATDDNAIQMLGTIALDPLDPYDAEDCPRYGAWAGGNCGSAVPVEPQDESPTDVAGVAGRVEELIDQLGQDSPTPDRKASGQSKQPDVDETPAPSSGRGLLSGVLDLLQRLASPGGAR